MPTNAQKLLPSLQNYCKGLEAEFSQIPEERKSKLSEIAQFIKNQQSKAEAIYLTFICTHNSRRSQFGQVWAKVAATYYGFNVNTYSGGTESTACNPRTVAALQRVGFMVEKSDETSDSSNENPQYKVVFSKKVEPLILFSKKYNNSYNPQQNFVAILVCSSADDACPLVTGAVLRIYHGYDDPKKSDGKPNESTTYDETCRLIARELFYVFSQAKQY